MLYVEEAYHRRLEAPYTKAMREMLSLMELNVGH